MSVANPARQGRSEAGHFRPVGQYRPENSTPSPYRGYGNTGQHAYQGWPVGQYRPRNPIPSPYRGYGNTAPQAYRVRSEAGPFRPVGQYRPENPTPSPYRGGNTAYQVRSEAGPFRPVGQYRPENPTPRPYGGYGNGSHQPSPVTKPAYKGKSEAGSITWGGYRGRGAHQSSEVNAYCVSNNRPQQGGSNTLPANNWSIASPIQHPNPPLATCPGRGRGIGRGRGRHAANLES